MKLIIPTWLSWFIFIGITSCDQTSKQTKHSAKEAITKIDALISPISRSNNFSGNVLVKQESNTIFSKSYGYSDRENKISHNMNSRFFIGSVSAMFTATAIMQLVEEGELKIDDRLSQFIREFPNGDNITIHHLLTERSGLPRVISERQGKYKELIRSAHTLDDLVSYAKALDPIAQPGEKYRHSGTSYILLAKVIEILSGKPFGQYLQDHIFNLLEMDNTGHYSYETKYEEIPDLALGYEQKGVTELKRAERIHWSSKIGHASIYSTTADLYQFAEAILQEKLLSADSWNRITNSYYNSTLGYGISKTFQDDHLRYHRSGGSPGFASYFAIYPKEKLTVIMLSNVHIHVPYFNVPKIASIIFEEPYEQLNLVDPTYVSSDYAKKLLGTFQFDEKFYSPNGTVTITYQQGMLLSNDAPMIPVVGENGEITRFVNRQFWSRLEFATDSSGLYSRLKFDGFEGYKIRSSVD